jgi:hypothetical protein
VRRTGFGRLRIAFGRGFCEHGNEPSGFKNKAGYYLTSRVTISFSKNILFHGVIK